MLKFVDLFTYTNFEMGMFYDCTFLKEIPSIVKIGDHVDNVYYNPVDNSILFKVGSQDFKAYVTLNVVNPQKA